MKSQYHTGRQGIFSRVTDSSSHTMSTDRSVVETVDRQEQISSRAIFRRRDEYDFDSQATRKNCYQDDHHHLLQQSQGYSHDSPRPMPLIPTTGSSGSYSYHPPPTHSLYHTPSFSYGRVPPPYDSNVIVSLSPPASGGAIHSYQYPFHPPAYHGYPHYHWAPVLPVEYISDIKPSDVLCGRGGATNSHSGNRSFRSLVKQYQDQYLKAKKRDKPAVASIIVQKIRDKGGRFLKRSNTAPEGHVLWIDIGDERAKEKTCQALREGAPEIRKKRKTTSTDEEDTKKSGVVTRGELSPNSSIDRSNSNDAGNGSFGNRTQIVRNTGRAHSCQYPSQPKSTPIMIRPSATLIRRRLPESISIDQLGAHERELYLRDFLPPDPEIRQQGSPSYTINPPVVKV